MTFLPIVGRELRVASRLPATFRNRALTAGAVAVVATLMLLFASMTGSPSFIGGATFRTLAYLTLGFCFLEGVRKTADCLSEEKRDGTLGLLFLTDLKGYDVVFGKLAATSLNSLYGLVAILPVLSLPLLVGGVTAGEYWRVVLALLNILFFSLCAGMCVSSRSVRQQQAAGATMLVIVLFSVVPLLTFTPILYPLSPFYGFRAAFAGYYAGGHTGFWESLALTQLWSWLMLVWASLAVPRSWQENEGRGQWQTGRRRPWHQPLGRVESRESMLALNPVLWLAARKQAPTPALNLLVILAVLGSGAFVISHRPEFLYAYAFGAMVLNLLVKMLLAEQSARFFAEARRDNALEMILGTPLNLDQIIKGQILALERLFLVPIIALLSLEFLGGLFGIWLASVNGLERDASSDLSFFIIATMLYLAIFFADVSAIIWAGMWFGLTSKKENQAATRTILYVLVMPLVALAFTCPGYIAFICIPVFWMSWGKSNLYSKLRALTGYRYGLIPIDLSGQLRPGFGALPNRP
jgi:hypothetical protein